VGPGRDDTSSQDLERLQQERADDEARLADDADQPAEARSHRRRSEKAAYLRDRLAEAAEADADTRDD
jgi:hypothetical protein